MDIDIINKQIDILSNRVDILEKERQNILSNIDLINKVLTILEDETKILNYDFKDINDLLSKSDYSIDNLDKKIINIKNALQIKYEYNLSIDLSSSQKENLNKLKDSLSNLKEELHNRLESLLNMKEYKYLKDLVDIKDVLLGKSDNNLTLDMFNNLVEALDIYNMKQEDLITLLRPFYNMNLTKKRESINIEDVISLYKKYLNKQEFNKDNENNFISLIYKYQEEILEKIDLERSKNILEFLDSVGILHKFSRVSLLSITLYGRLDYIKRIYEEIKDKSLTEQEKYFEDITSTLWVCEEKTRKRRGYKKIKNHKEMHAKDKSLYAKCHRISNDEYESNLVLLDKYKYMFGDKFKNTDGSYLDIICMNPKELQENTSIFNMLLNNSWLFKKNIGLLHLFGFGILSKLPVRCLNSGDVEDKIHYAVELGLLNPPMNEEYLEKEKSIVKYSNFQDNVEKKGLVNISIRDYFQRYSVKLAILSYNEYVYLLYKLSTLGQLDFYNYFFSSNQAGKKSSDLDLFGDDREIIDDKDKLQSLIDNTFVNLSSAINNYNVYDKIISEYKSTNDDYYDISILEDPLIIELERTHTTYDLLIKDGKVESVPNEFVYLFNGSIISRMKVLHNASILKESFGYLDMDMLYTSIFRNSYLSDETFTMIKNNIKGENIKR